MKRILPVFSFILFSLVSNAGTVDTVSIFSNSMHRNIKCVVIKPDIYKHKITKFPVVYFLHGYGGSYSNCITRIPQLKEYADTYGMIIVCPDGALSSWYLNSPVDSNFRYETHIAYEVVDYIDKHYKTLADKNHRAITGLSMGGYGALFLSLRHPDIFGAAAAMSGAMDISSLKGQFDIIKRVGDTIIHAGDWYKLSLVNMIGDYANTPVKIIFDCGIKDIFIDQNRRMHQKMLELNIPHEYTERPGLHGWDYWRNSIPYHLFFFRNFFNITR